MVLDGIVGSTLQNVSDVSPFVGLISVQKIKDPLLIRGPLSVPLDKRVEVVVPSLSALFTDTTWEMMGNLSPLFGSVGVYE